MEHMMHVIWSPKVTQMTYMYYLGIMKIYVKLNKMATISSFLEIRSYAIYIAWYPK